MTENRRQVLDMLAQGKVSVEEAERLLALVDAPSGSTTGGTGSSDKDRPRPQYLRVVVEPDTDASGEAERERVNIRVPMALLRAGVRLAALLPTDATAKVNEKLREKGIEIDLANLKAADLEGLVDAMADLEVDVQDGQHKVRVFIE